VRRKRVSSFGLALFVSAILAVPLGAVIRQASGPEPLDTDQLVAAFLIGPFLIIFACSLAMLPLRLLLAICRPGGSKPKSPGTPEYARAIRNGLLIGIAWIPICAGAASLLAMCVIARANNAAMPSPPFEPLATTLLMAAANALVLHSTLRRKAPAP
jgi:hypothetical protein